jgi:hypothetical protein
MVMVLLAADVPMRDAVVHHILAMRSTRRR